MFMRKAISPARLAVIVALLLAVDVGCSRSRRPELPKTYPVTGIVSFDSKPLPGATVMFNPAAGGGHGAIAVTDPTGRYKLTTFAPADGVVPGDYKVAITKTVIGGTEPDTPASVAPDPKNVLPAKYADDSTSGFKATVEATPDNTFDFALSK
jgi:hypothetical protein